MVEYDVKNLWCPQCHGDLVGSPEEQRCGTCGLPAGAEYLGRQGGKAVNPATLLAQECTARLQEPESILVQPQVQPVVNRASVRSEDRSRRGNASPCRARRHCRRSARSLAASHHRIRTALRYPGSMDSGCDGGRKRRRACPVCGSWRTKIRKRWCPEDSYAPEHVEWTLECKKCLRRSVRDDWYERGRWVPGEWQAA